MDFLTGAQKHSWQPNMTSDTTNPSYWLNWRILLCSIWVLISIVVASFLIWKYEGSRSNSNNENGEVQKEKAGILYEDEVWRPCLKEIHPAWLLAFRVGGFLALLFLLIVTVKVDGGSIFYYYTQWTFTLITVYFGLGSVLSMYGCYKYHNKVGGIGGQNEKLDAEQGTYTGLTDLENSGAVNSGKTARPQEGREIAGPWGYIFQIIFQMNAGAVMLTDCVFWFIIVPFLAIRDYNLNFLVINMHTINAVFLLGDTALNCLRFPWFRISYFFLWTAIYAIFQWILHACVSVWWPYPFLDLSSSFAPLWYLSVGVMHIPCYCLFALIMKLKHTLLSKWFPQSYQCMG